MGKQLMIKPEKCIGCRTCELVCSFGHDQVFNPRNANVTVMAYEEAAINIPVMCLQCEDPCCLEVCPTGAITFEDPDEGMDRKRAVADRFKDVFGEEAKA